MWEVKGNSLGNIYLPKQYTNIIIVIIIIIIIIIIINEYFYRIIPQS